ncbi:MAG: M15 family metallopeptidase [Fidelibacterota bacterium]|nr:MAG: M15 family metallopeptidase [Candidatus Neomarinimicrobiota bacterium]
MSQLHPKYVLILLVLASLYLAASGGQETEEGSAKPVRNDLFPIDPKSYLLGQFRPDTTGDFVRLPGKLTRGRAYLRSEAAEALERMVLAARDAGIHLTVISATRTFRQQRVIWNGKFTGSRRSGGRNLAREYPDSTERCRAILQYSSAPGTSRHHWGTDVDFNSTDPAYWRIGSGVAALHWLDHNAHEYGFFMAYPPDREHGYRYEPWHWSYQSLAGVLLRDYYDHVVSDEDLDGFLGARHFRRLPWREWYVNGVSKALK